MWLSTLFTFSMCVFNEEGHPIMVNVTILQRYLDFKPQAAVRVFNGQAMKDLSPCEGWQKGKIIDKCNFISGFLSPGKGETERQKSPGGQVNYTHIQNPTVTLHRWATYRYCTSSVIFILWPRMVCSTSSLWLPVNHPDIRTALQVKLRGCPAKDSLHVFPSALMHDRRKDVLKLCSVLFS